MAAYPASDPLVLAVGGTMGNPYPDGLLTDEGTYGGEQVWNEPSPFAPQAGASGGAPSVVFNAPPWQRSLQPKTKDRLVPDVAYNAALVDGALVILSCRQATDGSGAISFCDPTRQGYVAVGGTSAGSPQWAAIVALANQVRASQHRPSVGLVSPLLYELARSPRSYARDFHDVTVGDNRLDLTAFGAPAPSKFSFDAAPGYDLATGLGTPNVANLVADLAQRGNGDIPGNLARLLFFKGRLLHHRFDLSK
jgi:subtilase family serine protease